jgi:hypothetical protein
MASKKEDEDGVFVEKDFFFFVICIVKKMLFFLFDRDILIVHRMKRLFAEQHITRKGPDHETFFQGNRSIFASGFDLVRGGL